MKRLASYALALLVVGLGGATLATSISHLVNRLLDAWLDGKAPPSALAEPPGRNPNWQRAHYCIDEQNVTGCAHDYNDGSVCTCGGGGPAHGPLLHWSETWVNRLGCGAGGRCPTYQTGSGIVQQVFDFVSNDDEVIDFHALVEAGFQVDFRCLQPTSGVITTTLPIGFTPRSVDRSTGVTAGVIASGLLQFALPAITLSDAMVVYDTTANLTFWPYYDITTAGGAPGAGDLWAFSQALTTTSISRATPTEATPTSGDTLVIYPQVQLTLHQVDPVVQLSNGGASPGRNVQFANCDFQGSSTTFTINASQGVSFIEDHFNANLQIVPGSNGLGVLVNNSAPAAAIDYFNSGASFGGQQNFILGGIYGRQVTGSQNTLTCAGCQVDMDVVFGQTPGIYGASIGNFGGAMYADANVGVIVYPGSQLDFTQALPTSAIAFWGPGDLNVAATSAVTYRAGAGEATLTFLNKGHLGLFTGTTIANTFCSDFVTCGLPLTPTQLDLSLGAGATKCVGAPFAGSFCN